MVEKGQESGDMKLSQTTPDLENVLGQKINSQSLQQSQKTMKDLEQILVLDNIFSKASRIREIFSFAELSVESTNLSIYFSAFLRFESLRYHESNSSR